MDDVEELSQLDPVSAGESETDFSTADAEPRIKKHPTKRKNRGLPLDAKSTDRLLRLFLSLPRKPDPTRTAGAEKKETSPETNQETDQNAPTLDDLVHAHVFGSATFARDGREDSHKLLKQIDCHPALKDLDPSAKMVAAMHIFKARMASRLKAEGKYWVLSGIGEVYPYPLAIRTGASPSWKSQIRSLETLLEKIRTSASEALRLEADTMVSSRPKKMPAELICDAATALRKAISWMQAFPTPVALRSKYRNTVRPDAEESLGVLAYVLDRLYREHTEESSLKVKEIEYRIAKLETTFFGQSIQYDSEFGCPAVRLQIRAVKRSKERTGVDRALRASFKMANIKMRENDPIRTTAAFNRLSKRMDRHSNAYDTWVDRTEQRLKGELRQVVEATNDRDEVFEAVREHIRHMRNHLDLRQRWIGEYSEHLSARKSHLDLRQRWREEHSEHLNASDSRDLEFWSYQKLLREWMKRWESLWGFTM